MVKQSQIAWVYSQLKENGKISRNACLRKYISRLGAIVHTLRHDFNLTIEGGYVKRGKSKDFVYTLIK